MIKVNIRWSDIDANRHLANSAYINFMSYARVVYMKQAGVSQKTLADFNLGPIVFYEHIYYFREVMPDQPVYIDIELDGLSENGTFFAFKQNMYDRNGINVATYEMMGAWIDLDKRKLTVLPEDILHRFKSFKVAESFKTLTPADTRKHNKYAEDIDPQFIIQEV